MDEPTYGEPPLNTVIQVGTHPLPLKSGWTRVVCVGDTLGDTTFKVPAGDILIHTGNFLLEPSVHDAYAFVRWTGSLPHKHKILCLGHNEDIMIGDIIMHSTNCNVLNGTTARVEGLNIVNIIRTDPRPVPIVLDVEPDIVVSSVPPYGYLDLDEDNTRHGSELVTEEIRRTAPTLCVFGGVAAGHGIVRDGDTIFINAGIYEAHGDELIPFGIPVVVDIEQKQKPATVCCWQC